MGELDLSMPINACKPCQRGAIPLEAIDHLVPWELSSWMSRWCTQRTNSRKAALAGTRSMPS